MTEEKKTLNQIKDEFEAELDRLKALDVPGSLKADMAAHQTSISFYQLLNYLVEKEKEN